MQSAVPAKSSEDATSMRVSLNVIFWTGKMDRQAALMFGNRSRRLGFDFLKLRRTNIPPSGPALPRAYAGLERCLRGRVSTEPLVHHLLLAFLLLSLLHTEQFKVHCHQRILLWQRCRSASSFLLTKVFVGSLQVHSILVSHRGQGGHDDGFVSMEIPGDELMAASAKLCERTARANHRAATLPSSQDEDHAQWSHQCSEANKAESSIREVLIVFHEGWCFQGSPGFRHTVCSQESGKGIVRSGVDGVRWEVNQLWS